MAGLVLEDGRAWGDAAFGFQWEDTKAILTEQGPPYHFLTRARGSSKTTDLAGAAIALLLTLPHRSRLHWLAADRDQGALAIDAIGGFASRTPMLTGALEVQSWRIRFAPTDTTLDVLAADAPSAWGLRSHGVFVDEIAQWATTPGPQRLWEAVSTGPPKPIRLEWWSSPPPVTQLTGPTRFSNTPKPIRCGMSTRYPDQPHGWTTTGSKSNADGSPNRHTGDSSSTSGPKPKIGSPRSTTFKHVSRWKAPKPHEQKLATSWVSTWVLKRTSPPPWSATSKKTP